MKHLYIVLEIQKLSDTQVATPPLIQKNTWEEGESEYCRVRSVAAVSTVPIHTVVFMRDDGYLFDYKSYDHTNPSEEQEE